MFIMCIVCSEYTSWFVMLYYVMLCYGRFGWHLVVRISVPSLTLCHFVHLTNKRLVTCKVCECNNHMCHYVSPRLENCSLTEKSCAALASAARSTSCSLKQQIGRASCRERA